jgi:hypothetical protein
LINAGVVAAIGCLAAIAAPWTGSATGAPGAATTLAPLSQLRQSEITATETGDLYFFGRSVAVSGDTMVVGAPGQVIGGQPNVGAAYVFVRGAAGWQDARQVATLTAGDAASEDQFGWTVAMTGSTIVVGSHDARIGTHIDQGAVYVFSEPTGGWKTATQTAKLTASDGVAQDELGSAVAIAGGTIVAGASAHAVGGHSGAGEAYVFSEPVGGWHDAIESATLDSDSPDVDGYFGRSVAISGDDIFIGSPGQIVTAGSQGAVFEFTRPSTGWANAPQGGLLVASDGGAGDRLGTALAVDGNTLVASAPDHDTATGTGALDIFIEPAGGWGLLGSQTAELGRTDSSLPADGYGGSLAISDNAILAGSPAASLGAETAAGSAYLYLKPASGWANGQIKANVYPTDGTKGADFGGAVGLTDTAVVATAETRPTSAGSGVAYVLAVPTPAVTGVKQTHATFTIGTKAARVNPTSVKGGTVFSFGVNDTAAVTLAFSKRKAGKTVSEGKITVPAVSTTARVYFDGVVSATKTLSPGKYAVRLSAVNSGGSVTGPRLSFTAKAKPKPKPKHHKKKSRPKSTHKKPRKQ